MLSYSNSWIFSVHGVHLFQTEAQKPGRLPTDHVHHPRSVSLVFSFPDNPVPNNALFLFLGEKELAEIELSHLDGHKGSKPVRCVARVQFRAIRPQFCRHSDALYK